MAPAFECRHLSVAYGDQPALVEVDLKAAPGETLAVLGPAGSGKTTLLYTLAGFLEPAGGEVHIGGRLVAAPGRSEPPERRGVGMVFQNYALWPHLTALDTVAYPLHRAGVARDEARGEALRLLEAMGVADRAGRRPVELSGGQQQRVGLARALARRATLYLFDEPTAHLDPPLRAALQAEIAQRRSAEGAAAVYATHDAGEALALADRVALLRDGRVVQVDTPVGIYTRPVDLWAARLTGPASLLAGRVTAVSGARVTVSVAGKTLSVEPGPAGLEPGREVGVLIRPDWVHAGGPLAGVVEQAWYRGPHTDYLISTGSGMVEMRLPGTGRQRTGDRVGLRLDRLWLVVG